MQKFIIDGNNLIGKIRELQRLQKKDKQAAREKLVLIIERYFSRKKVKISLHFDGFQNTPISISSAKIHYFFFASASSFFDFKESKKPDINYIR